MSGLAASTPPAGGRAIAAWLAVLVLLSACAETSPHPELPPSASDLVLMKSAQICQSKDEFLKANKGVAVQRTAWGAGEELRLPPNRIGPGSEESYYFNEEGLLVGALFVFPQGFSLKPYRLLRDTLGQLRPDVEFYLNLAQVATGETLETSSLYRTGDEKSTTQYVTMGQDVDRLLLLASVAIDPYEKLLNPYRKEFLRRIAAVKGGRADVRGAEDREPFASLQQFARGETAQLAYCGTSDPAVAAAAFGKAIETGFTDKAHLSEAYHKLGLALRKKGQLEEARKAMQQSLEIYPNRPEVLNNLGDVHKALGDDKKALAAFERAVMLRPNYPAARFNMAAAYETINVRRAITEYETYLALGEGVPGEEERMAQAKKRIADLGGKR